MKSKGISEERITTSATSDYTFVPNFSFIHNSKTAVKCKGNGLKEDNVTFAHRNVVNMSIVYEFNTSFLDLGTVFAFRWRFPTD